MRVWGFSPSPEDFKALAAAAAIYRDRWAAIRPPFPAAFDGSMDDVRALDYIDYEGIPCPGGGIRPAAMVCGEVLRRAAGLEWVIGYTGDWFVASPEDDDGPAIAICPFARLLEIECGGHGGAAGLHSSFLRRAAFDCLLLRGPEMAPMARELLGDDDGGQLLDRVEEALMLLRGPGPSAKARRRRRQGADHSHGSRPSPATGPPSGFTGGPRARFR